MKRAQFQSREFSLKYATGDAVCSDEIPPYDDHRERPATPEEAAIYGVERLLDGCGPDGFTVEVTDEEGITHHFDVYQWRDQWCCERRPASDGSHAGPSTGGEQ